MNYAAIKERDIANGPGVRVSLFVSGCPHRCKGCFNAVAWDFDYGYPFTEETVQHLLALLAPDYIKGLTLLGGEPFAPQNQPELLKLVQQVKQKYPQKTIWAYSGYLLEKDLLTDHLGIPSVTKKLLEHLEVLVDGPFVEEKKDLMLRFRGSSNQRLINMPATLAHGCTVLWEDWQGERK